MSGNYGEVFVVLKDGENKKDVPFRQVQGVKNGWESQRGKESENGQRSVQE